MSALRRSDTENRQVGPHGSGGTDKSKIARKTVKNEQARTRESEEYKKKPKDQSRSQKCQASVKDSQSWSIKVNKVQKYPLSS
ncbi:hypothetical protein Tco_0606791 [Tanacetum coccineum]